MAVKRNNFVIAGLGSSGTKFLANLMNQSEQWQVVHMGICQSFDMDGTTQVTAQPLLDARPRYFGDVNGMLLFHLLELRVGRKAVIIRNPRDTLLSWYCDAGGQLTPSFFSIYAGGYFALEECLEAGLRCIRFERMVADPDYVRRILRYFGILDVNPTAEMIGKKVNTKRNAFCGSYEAIDATTRARFERASGEFARKYYESDPTAHADDFADVGDEGCGAPDGPDIDANAPPPKPLMTRSTTLVADEPQKESSFRVLPLEAVVTLASRLGLASPDDSSSQRRLEEVRMSKTNMTLFVIGTSGGPQRILIEPRTDAAPFFKRTRHLHISYVGQTASAALLDTISGVVMRLGDVTFVELSTAAGEAGRKD